MPNNKGFVLLELLMEGFTALGLLVVFAMISIQSAIAWSAVSDSRQEASFAAIQWDLENLDARQSIHYVDGLAYSSSLSELQLTPSDGVEITVGATEHGWWASATHASLDPHEGCAIHIGPSPPPHAPVTPEEAGELACTN